MHAKGKATVGSETAAVEAALWIIEAYRHREFPTNDLSLVFSGHFTRTVLDENQALMAVLGDTIEQVSVAA